LFGIATLFPLQRLLYRRVRFGFGRATFLARPISTAVIGLATALVLCSCETSRVVAPYVVVREAQFRTEQSVSDRISLPLDARSRDRILRYLKAGGNTQLYGKGIADPGAEQHYNIVLQRLSQPMTSDDLKSAELKKLFSRGPLYQIIDSRERFALSDTQVAAMFDGSYWWIFYHANSKTLDHLLITRAIGTKPSN
jgi:hypothetical protein